jgi:hypothetical protein
MRDNENRIRARINKALYAGLYVDIVEAFKGFLDWSDFCEAMGDPVVSKIAEDIADGYFNRARCLTR